MKPNETSKINCAICKTQLRISLTTGKKEKSFAIFKVSELGGPEKLIEELKKPARHVCPECGSTYCPNCLSNMLCPICKTRVRLG